jgi:CheY-like chemotaxis protein
MIVDDDKLYTDMLKRHLKKNNYIAEWIHSAYDFFNWCEKGKAITFDLILLDVLMDGMSGIEALKIFRERRCFSHIPIIIISGDIGVNSIKFNQMIHKYNPVKTFYKANNTKNLINIIDSLIYGKQIKKFNFDSLCSKNLNNSIMIDHLMHMGFYPMERSIESIKSKINIQSKGFKHIITLTISNLEGEIKLKALFCKIFDRIMASLKGCQINVQKVNHRRYVNSILIDKLNQSTRHAIQNKLDIISIKVNNILEKEISDEIIKLSAEVKNSINIITKNLKYIKNTKVSL